ncbi:ABC transporter ATP-binding protein [Ochrobactrum sp. BTU2]|uniref:ABC transporter ATP-binding protein n=1 Tax=Ochrobactrum sp. BTU2 TaxID=2856166 RepID=UPI00211A8EE2|nr:ABC transporter ATP-binding protein [Ochrobactrum sp. BTU2]MCQ9146170.1 ABC transporter ATP-binding protein [Ochrobactrum sp. BTU2]
MTASPLALHVESATVRYGSVPAVTDVSLVLEQGRITTIIGANGAGKSTLLNAITGVLALDGRVSMFGQPLNRYSVEERVVEGLVLIPERRELFSSMTVEENLLLGGYTQRARADSMIESIYDDFPRLKERRKQEAGTLSGGERQMLAMGRALMAHPKVLLLDEPSLGLAPLIVREILNIVVRLKESGVSILLVEQNARAALRIADTAYVMENGRFILEGAGSEVAADSRVEAIYMGGH